MYNQSPFQTVTPFLHHAPLPALPGLLALPAPSNHGLHQHLQTHAAMGPECFDQIDAGSGCSFSTSGSGSLLLYESRQTNREVRLQFTDISLKLDRIITKIDQMGDQCPDVSLRSSANSAFQPGQSSFQLIRENQDLKSKLQEMTIKLDGHRESVTRLLENNQKLLDQNVDLIGRTMTSVTSTTSAVENGPKAILDSNCEEELGVLRSELASMRIRETECQRQIAKLIQMDQENKQELQKYEHLLTENSRTIERLNSDVSEEKKARREAEMTSRALASDVEDFKSKADSLNKILTDLKSDSSFKVNQLELEIRMLSEAHQQELTILKEKMKREKMKAEEEMTEQLHQAEEDLSGTWKRKMENLEKTLKERHSMDIDELTANETRLKTRVNSLEQKLSQLKEQQGEDQRRLSVVQKELEENQHWKPKYESLRSRAVSMKDRYEEQTMGMKEEISFCEEKYDRLNARYEKLQETTDVIKKQFEDSKIRSALEKKELGSRIGELQLELASARSQVDDVTARRRLAEAEVEKSAAENRRLLEKVEKVEKALATQLERRKKAEEENAGRFPLVTSRRRSSALLRPSTSSSRVDDPRDVIVTGSAAARRPMGVGVSSEVVTSDDPDSALTTPDREIRDDDDEHDDDNNDRDDYDDDDDDDDAASFTTVLSDVDARNLEPNGDVIEGDVIKADEDEEEVSTANRQSSSRPNVGVSMTSSSATPEYGFLASNQEEEEEESVSMETIERRRRTSYPELGGGSDDVTDRAAEGAEVVVTSGLPVLEPEVVEDAEDPGQKTNKGERTVDGGQQEEKEDKEEEEEGKGWKKEKEEGGKKEEKKDGMMEKEEGRKGNEREWDEEEGREEEANDREREDEEKKEEKEEEKAEKGDEWRESNKEEEEKGEKKEGIEEKKEGGNGNEEGRGKEEEGKDANEREREEEMGEVECGVVAGVGDGLETSKQVSSLTSGTPTVPEVPVSSCPAKSSSTGLDNIRSPIPSQPKDAAFTVTSGGQIISGWGSDDDALLPVGPRYDYAPPEVDVRLPVDGRTTGSSMAELDDYDWFKSSFESAQKSDKPEVAETGNDEETASRVVGACVMLKDDDIRTIFGKKKLDF